MNSNSYGLYIFESRRKVFVVVAAIVVLFFVLFLLGWYSDVQTAWTEHLEWMVATATLVVALSVFFSEVRDEWYERLPKKLTVSFVYEGVEVMHCRDATLTGEGDIRAMSQQIGRQMVSMVKDKREEANLPLKPMLDNFTKRLIKDKREVNYTATINLRDLPQCLMVIYKNNQKLIWVSPFERDQLSLVDCLKRTS